MPHPVSEERAREGLTEVTGGCRGQEADLAVVDDLSRLVDCPDDTSTGGRTLHQVLAIVARGLPVITSASWNLARGDPGRVPKESIIRHRPLAMEAKCIFECGELFVARARPVFNLLTTLSNIPNSTWKVRLSTASAEGRRNDSDKGYEIVKVADVGDLRLWVQQHRRIYNTLGMKAWTLTQTIA